MRYSGLGLFLIPFCIFLTAVFLHQGAAAQSLEQLKQYNVLHKDDADGDSHVRNIVGAIRTRGNSIEFTLALISTLIILAMFVRSIKKRGEGKEVRLLGALLSQLFIYALFNFFLINATHPPSAALSIKFAGAGITLALVASLHMLLSTPLPLEIPKAGKTILFLLYSPALVFIGLLPTDTLIAGVRHEINGFSGIEGPLYHAYVCIIVLYFSAGILILGYNFTRAGGAERNRIGFLGVGFSIPMLAFCFSRSIPLTGNANIAFHSVSMCCCAMIITYAILAGNLFDLHLLISPLIKNRKYHFHRELGNFTERGAKSAFTHGRIAKSLSRLFDCDVAVNLDGKPAAAAGGGADFKRIDIPAKVRDNLPGCPLIYTRKSRSPGIQSGLEPLKNASVEAFHVISMAAGSYCLLKFGPGVKKIVYSSQDMKRLRILWNELEKCLIFIDRFKKKSREGEVRIKELEKELAVTRNAIRDEGIDFRQSPPGRRGVTIRIALFGDLRDHAPGSDPRKEYLVFHWDATTPVKSIKDWSPHVVLIEGRRVEENREALEYLNMPLLVITDAQEEIMAAHRLFPRLLIEYAEPGLLKDWPAVLDRIQALAAVEAATLYQSDDQRLVSRNSEIVDIVVAVHGLNVIPAAILLTGESGTGKELLAECISEKFNLRMTTVNCASSMDGLFEARMFGHAKDAFTGAVKDKKGALEKADGGILFLDEVGDMSPINQAALLRALDSKTFTRLGEETPRKPNFLIVAATNKDLDAMAEKGEFRKDFLRRIRMGMHFHIPDLSERPEDIPLIAQFILGRCKGDMGKNVMCPKTVIDDLKNRPLPGNVRDLQHLLREGAAIAKENEPLRIKKRAKFREMDIGEKTLKQAAMEFEIDYISAALTRTDNDIAETARLLGMGDVSTLRKKMKRYGMPTTRKKRSLGP